MNRSSLLKSLFMALSVLLGGSAVFAESSANRPNIIFIFADDWGYGDLSSHGSSFVQTPHLDRMASEGIDFQNFTVNSPVCSPSRVAAISGKFPAYFNVHQHFAGAKSNKKRGMPDWLDPTAAMLPRLLKESGYKTGHFGKWHLGAGKGVPTEDEYGYDEYATFNGSKTIDIPKGGLASVDYAEGFIREHKEEPFFINLWLHEVHLAHFPLEKYLKQFEDLDEQKRVYASVIAEGDEGVGRILALLEELDLDEKTLVVFSSDNGAERTRGEEHKYHNESNIGLGGYYSVGESGGLLGGKRSLFAGGIRVPFIVRWPGVVPEGKVDRDSVLTAVDLLPTFLDAAGVELPAGFEPDGESALSAFKGESFERRKPIFWEWKGGSDQSYTWPSLGARVGDWKLLVNKETGQVELYDIAKDWAEKNDVSKEYPEVVKNLTLKLDTWKRSLPKKPPVHVLSKSRFSKK